MPSPNYKNTVIISDNNLFGRNNLFGLFVLVGTYLFYIYPGNSSTWSPLCNSYLYIFRTIFRYSLVSEIKIIIISI